ncbi:uncharacterized protein LOC132700807 [Cylas formicarius]|uniref:uncharacterized protein LOC132700807 n=1 Tax=Cylas formicarius TaxID=197179 RepID=UPI002958C6CE|nr:uncharacterized protein LOC132700807 [Cylas formicarius]
MKVSSYFTHVRRLMMMIGIWKVENPDTSRFRKHAYRIYSLSFQLFCYSAAVSLLAEIPSLAKTDVAAAMDNANRVTVYIVIIIKMIAWQSKEMVELLRDILRQNSQMRAASRTDLRVCRIYRGHSRHNHKFMCVLVSSAISIWVAVSGIGNLQVYRFIRAAENVNVTEKPQLLRYWYPFDKHKHHVIVMVDQNVRLVLSCFCLGVTSSSLNSLAIFVRAQLKMLQYRFQHFHRRDQDAPYSLKLLCTKHQRLISYTINFSQSLKYIVLLDYTVCSATFALLILQIMAEEELLINFTILTFTTLQLMTFSWNCNEIIVQVIASSKLSTALFKSDWYDQEKSAKVLIHIMMMRCQKPLCLRIGWFGVMDLNAGISVSVDRKRLVKRVGQFETLAFILYIYHKVFTLMHAQFFIVSWNMSLDYFTHVRRLMMVIGIWKVDTTMSISRKRIYRVYSLFFQLFCHSTALSSLVEIPSLLKSDVDAAMDNANRIVVYIVIIIKMIIWQSKRMVRLLGVVLEQDQQMRSAALNDQEILRLYGGHVRYNQKFMFVLVLSGTSIAFVIAAIGDINVYQFVQSPENANATEKPLPCRYWYPFDRNKYYLVALVDQHVRPTLGCFCLGVTSASLNSLAIFVRVQLKVLQHHFQHFHQQQDKALDSLKLLCVKHQLLIEYTIEFSESLKHIVLLDYSVSSVTFAVLILQVTAGEELIISVTILTFTTLQLMTFSWNCNEIIVQSTELATALFESDWYDQEESAKVLIHIMMMRCQKPLCLRIGWLGVMDLEAGMSVNINPEESLTGKL